MNFATFDLNLLRVLDALFREGSTVKASARLGLSQPAVSSSLSRLRHALDDPLFVRQGNRLVPTDFAENLRHGVQDELNRIELLLSKADAFDPEKAEGHFKISGSDFFAELLMPNLGDLLTRTAPKLRAQLVDLVPDDYLASLERYDADLALIPDCDLPSWISREPLFRSPFVVIARGSNPGVADLEDFSEIPIDRFCAMPHVLFSPEGRLSAMGDTALAKIGRSRNVAMTVQVFSGVCRVVRGSDLIALIPAQLAVEFKNSYDLRIFKAPMPMDVVQIVGIWHSRSDNAPFARWMRQQVFELCRSMDMAPPA